MVTDCKETKIVLTVEEKDEKVAPRALLSSGTAVNYTLTVT